MSRTFRVVDSAGSVCSIGVVDGNAAKTVVCETDDTNGMRIATRWARQLCQEDTDNKGAYRFVVSTPPLDNGESQWVVVANGSFAPLDGPNVHNRDKHGKTDLENLGLGHLLPPEPAPA